MKLLIWATVLAALSFFSHGKQPTCFVVAPDFPQAFDRAKAVFIGEVVEITKPNSSEPDAPLADRFYSVTFKVEYSWKGAGFREVGVPEIVVLSDQGMGRSCFSWGSFSQGEKYLVYAEETAEKNLVVQGGNRTANLGNASEDLKDLERMSHPFFKFQYKRSVSSVFSQGKERIVQWPETPISNRNTVSSGHSQVLAQIEALQINDITVGGKSITIGQPFAADEEWLKSLTVRVKNVSTGSISSIQINLFLPEIMPGGPLVTLCYGCGDVGKGQSIMPGEEVEARLVFYSWLKEKISEKSSLSSITKAEIHDIIVRLPDGKQWISGCVRAASLKNACPTTAP